MLNLTCIGKQICYPPAEPSRWSHQEEKNVSNANNCLVIAIPGCGSHVINTPMGNQRLMLVIFERSPRSDYFAAILPLVKTHCLINLSRSIRPTYFTLPGCSSSVDEL